MTDRERWIVYPLIFLALGVALRDKITRTLNDVELIGGDAVQMDFKHGVVAGESTHAQIDFAQGLVQAETIRCKQLIVEQELTANRVVTRRVAANEIVVSAAGGEVRILLESLPKAGGSLPGSDKTGGRIVVFGPDGKAQVLLSPGTAGGEVSVVDESLRLRLNFGGFREGVMLEGETAGGNRIPFLTLPPGLNPTETKPEPKKQPDSDSPGPPEPTDE